MSRRFVAIAAGAAAVGFAFVYAWIAWLVLNYFYVPYSNDADVPLFQQYATDILKHQMPYKDFTFLYPPGALPAFVIPGWLVGPGAAFDIYRTAFQALMLACGAIMAILVVVTLSRVTDRKRDVLIGAALIAASPVLLGWVMVLRYDLWPAVLTAATMLTITLARYRVAAVLLGLAILAKVYPVVLAPLLLAYVWRHAGRRQALIFVAITIGVIAVAFAPFLFVAPTSFISTMTKAFARDLQVESLGAAVLFTLHGLNDLPLKLDFGGGSHNLVGPLPDLAIAIQSVALAVMLLIVWIRFARGRADARALLLAAAAATCIYVGLGRVLSDQYVIWLIPLVAMVPFGAARIGAIGLVAILALSNWIYPGEYAAYEREFRPQLAWVVLARVVAIFVLGVYLAKRADLSSGEIPVSRDD